MRDQRSAWSNKGTTATLLPLLRHFFQVKPGQIGSDQKAFCCRNTTADLDVTPYSDPQLHVVFDKLEMRELVNGVQEVGGSNPLAPTSPQGAT